MATFKVITTYNNKLYKEYAYRFKETYNWPFPLKIYNEDECMMKVLPELKEFLPTPPVASLKEKPSADLRDIRSTIAPDFLQTHIDPFASAPRFGWSALIDPCGQPLIECLNS